MSELNKTFLHTGSNLGEKATNLAQARSYIEEKIGPIIQASLVYNTKAWGITDQPDFLNQALEIQTSMSPIDLLDTILQIEQEIGRKREIKWGERLIDIDILFYNDLIIDQPRLTIPHPYLHYRNFVLVPMLEIAPNFLHPILNKTIKELHSNSNDKLIVEALAL